MRDETIQRLRRLNQEFYQTFAKSFAETRARLQPGVVRILKNIAPQAAVLDLGCGHGELAAALTRNGHHGRYLGLDASAVLLSIACERSQHPQVRFQQADLSDPDWSDGLPAPFDHIFAFAVLHHIPGQEQRQRVVQQIYSLLASGGRFVSSNWNFMASPRLRARIMSWETVDIEDDELETGDYLLDWRRGGKGLRYVHLFNETELKDLADETGFEIIETFYSDGEGGRLGLYQVWEKE